MVDWYSVITMAAVINGPIPLGRVMGVTALVHLSIAMRAERYRYQEVPTLVPPTPNDTEEGVLPIVAPIPFSATIESFAQVDRPDGRQ